MRNVKDSIGSSEQVPNETLTDVHDRLWIAVGSPEFNRVWWWYRGWGREPESIAEKLVSRL